MNEFTPRENLFFDMVAQYNLKWWALLIVGLIGTVVALVLR